MTNIDESPYHQFSDNEDPNTVSRQSKSSDVQTNNCIGTLVHDLLDHIDEIQQGGINTVPPGFCDVDAATQGLRPKQLVVVTGRPAMDESVLALDFARTAAIHRHMTTAVFSLRMSAAELTQRVISAETDIPLAALSYGKYLSDITPQRWSCLNNFWARIRDNPLFVYDGPANPTKISEECRTLKRAKDLKLVVIDYLQLLVPDEGTVEMRGHDASDAAHALKLLAEELGVVVVLVSQLGAGLETRDDRKPQLSNLWHCVSVEQTADMVFLVHRPEIYNPWDHPGKADIIMAKNHNGPTRTFHLEFHGDTSKFTDLTEDEYAP